MTIMILLVNLIGYSTMGQEKNEKNYLWKFDGKRKEQTIGGYLGLSGSYTDISGKLAGWLTGKAGIVINHRFTVGLAGSALWYDHALNTLVTDGTYHLESGYAGAWFEYMQPFGSRFRLGFSLFMGQGVAKFTYDKEFREGKPWYQQTIDQQNYAVTEPGIEALVRVAPKWWIGLNGSYKFTSPLRLADTPDDLFNTFSGGVSVRFGLF